MTTLSLEQANNTLAAAKINLRISSDGLATLSNNERFNKAMQFCVKNAKARQDVLSYLDHLKTQPGQLVIQPNQPAQQPAPAQQSRPLQPTPEQTAQQSASIPAPTPDQGNEDRMFVTHHVYGGKAALDFKLSETRRDASPTISIDGAPAQGKNNYDWSKKTTLQVTLNDLPSVAAVFFGLMKSIELRHYGANNDKSIKLEHQGDKIFVQMSATEFSVQVPVPPGDAFQIRNLFLRQLMAKHPEVGVEGILANLKCHAMMMKPQGQPQR